MSQYHAVIAEFDSAAAIYQAAKKTTDEGYTRVDAFTPFPIHGLDKALKQKDSPLGWIVIIGGATGLALSQLMMWWMNAEDYVLWVSGKNPYWWPSTVPISFEMMVLFSAFGAFFGMFILNRLPRLHHPIFNHSTFHRVTDDRFFLAIEARDPKFDSGKTPEFLTGIGGKAVELVEEA